MSVWSERVGAPQNYSDTDRADCGKYSMRIRATLITQFGQDGVYPFSYHVAVPLGLQNASRNPAIWRTGPWLEGMLELTPRWPTVILNRSNALGDPRGGLTPAVPTERPAGADKVRLHPNHNIPERRRWCATPRG